MSDTPEAEEPAKPKTVPLWRKLGITISKFDNCTLGADGSKKTFNESWRVIVPAKVTGHGRLRKAFKTKSKALAYAEGKADIARSTGKRAFALTDAQREDAVEALKILHDLGLNFTEAAQFAQKHLRPEGGDITTRQLMDRILREKAREQLRPASIQSLRYYGGQIPKHFGEDRQVKTLTREDLRKWFDDLEDQGAGHRHLKNYIRYTAQFFRYAQVHGFRADNPASLIKPPRVEWKPPAILTVREAKRLLQAASLPEYKELLPALVLQLFCGGLRSAEVDRLTWDDIDLAGKKLEILPATGKNRRDGDWRTPAIPDNALEFLLLHPTRSGRVTPKKFRFKMTALHKAAGFASWDETHDNSKRHSFGSYGCKAYGQAWVQDQMGHNTSGTFLKFYRNARVSEAEAAEYFAIQPGNLESGQAPIIDLPKVVSA